VGFTPSIPKSLDAFHDFDNNNFANVSRLEVIIFKHTSIFICSSGFIVFVSPNYARTRLTESTKMIINSSF